MRVGFVTPSDTWDSLNHVRQMTANALAARHEPCPFPVEYQFASQDRRRAILKDWLQGLDAFIGPLKHDILRARREMARSVPWLGFIFGAMPRGAFGLSDARPYIYTSDVLICNSSADLTLSKKIFPNVNSRWVPLAYDDSVFTPASEEARRAARCALGLTAEDRIVLYAGRFTIEKNVHTVLKTFRVVLDAVPNAKLLLAGDEMRAPFMEFGSMPLSIKRLLRRTRSQLGLDDSRVMLVGPRSAVELRDLFSTADVLLNLTLHHDENFGLAQVEAMACGLPAVGTAWGGLKDTIVDGVTGAHVPAVVTATGVKVDWWSAANSVVQLLKGNGPTFEMRQRCAEHAREQYSRARYSDNLDRILLETVDSNGHPRETLARSSFAEEFWRVCAKNPEEPPPYRRGRAAMDLYRELITPYATAPRAWPIDEPGSIWYLPVALSFVGNDAIEVNDPVFPFELSTPADLTGAIRALVDMFADQPVQSGSLLDLDDRTTRDALAWMHEHGLLLPTCAGGFTPNWERLRIGRMAFRMQRVDHETDLVWFS